MDKKFSAGELLRKTKEDLSELTRSKDVLLALDEIADKIEEGNAINDYRHARYLVLVLTNRLGFVIGLEQQYQHSQEYAESMASLQLLSEILR